MNTSDLPALIGHFLIAMPGLTKPPFARSVTLLCQHNEEGAIGFLVNQLSELHISHVLAQMHLTSHDPILTNAPVLIGGTIQPERGFVLHHETGNWEASYHVNDTCSVTTSRDILTALATGQGPRATLMILGYSVWTAGQLEQEIRDNVWLTVKANANIMFDTPPEERWRAAVRLAGIDPLSLSQTAGHV